MNYNQSKSEIRISRPSYDDSVVVQQNKTSASLSAVDSCVDVTSLSSPLDEVRKLNVPNFLLNNVPNVTCNSLGISGPSPPIGLLTPAHLHTCLNTDFVESHSALSNSISSILGDVPKLCTFPMNKIPNPLNLSFSRYCDPELFSIFSDLDPKIGPMVQNFSLCFVGVCSSTNNVATGVIFTQYLQTLCDKPLYSYCSDMVLNIIAKFTDVDFQSHSDYVGDKGNNISEYFNLLISNFSKAQSCTEYFGDICTLLTFAVSTGLVDKTCPNFGIERINSLVKLIKPQQKGSKSPAELLLNTVIGVATYVATLFGINVNPIDDDYEVEFAKVVAMVESLSSGTFSDHFPDVSRKSIVQRISALILKYEALVLSAGSPMEKTMYGSKLQKLLLVKQKAVNVVKNEQFVEQAFGLVIFGTSSIGKSHLVDIIAKSIGICNGFPVEPENIAVITPGDKYDTTITPATTFCIFDDVATQRDFSLNEIVRLLIRFINNIPTPALKAGVEEKGTVVINPSLVIATTNVKDMQIPLLATNPIAPMRRVLYLTASVLPEYSTNGMLDGDKIPTGDMADTDVWILKLERAIPCPVSGYKFEIIEDNMRIGRCIKVLNDLSKAHFAVQRRIVAQKYKSSVMTLCPCNSVLRLCRTCSPLEPEMCSHALNFGSNPSVKLLSPGYVASNIFNCFVKYPVVRLLSLGIVSTIGGRDLLCDYANMFFVLCQLIAFSFYMNGNFITCVLCAVMSSLFRFLVSQFVKHVDSYYTLVDFYSDSVNYISIKTGIDSERLSMGLRYCTYGIAVGIAIKMFKAYKTLRLDFQSKDFDHPDVVVRDEIKHNPWRDAELKSRSPRDISMVVSSNPSVHLDQQKSFLHHLDANRILVECVLKTKDSNGSTMHRRFCALRIDSQHVLVNTHSLTDASVFKVLGFNTPIIIKPGTHMDFGDDLSLVHWSGGGAKRDLTQYFYDGPIDMQSNITVHYPEGPVYTVLDSISLIKASRATFDGYLYTAPSEPGKCGSAVTLTSRNVIIGLHAAGSPETGVAACIPISKSKITDMVQRFTKSLFPLVGVSPPPAGSSFLSGSTIIEPSFELHSSAISNYAEYGSSVQVHGCFPVGHPLGPRSSPADLTPLVVSNNITAIRGPPKKFIPVMTGKAGKQALESTMTKWNMRPVGFSPLEFAQAGKEMLSNYDGIDLSSLRPVSDAQAINGIHTALLCPPINPNTSGGFPFPGTKMAHLYNNPDDDGRNRFSFDEFSREKYDKFDNSIRMGLPYEVPIATTSLKVEPRPLGKYPRPINTFPMSTVVAFRKYFMMFSRLDSMNIDKTGVALGTNPYGPDFEAIHSRLFYDGAGIIAGDFSSYDTLISVDALMCVYGVIYELCVRSGNYSREDLNAVRELSNLSMNWFTVIDGLLISVAGANSSGHPLTTLINCKVNQIFMICAYNRLKPSKSLLRYSDSIRYVYYGDDNLLSVGEDSKSFFNQMTLTAAFAEVGVKYTDANKSASAKNFESHDEASFLKRTFKYHPDIKCVVGALDIDAIYDSFRYASKSSIVHPRSEAMHTAELFDNAIMEFFFHGPEVYKQHYEILEKIAVNIGIYYLLKSRNISYRDRVIQWFSDYGRT